MALAPLADVSAQKAPLPAPPFGFRDLIAPCSPNDFFRDHYKQRFLHVPGTPEKAEKILTWQGINELLAMTTIWSDHNCELALDGEELPKEAYCYRTTDRNNEPRLRPDYRRMRAQLRKGATLAMNFIERLTPALRELDTSMEMVLQAPVNMTAFVSWQGLQGYMSHFDTTNVFVLHLGGTKRWNIYKGRHPHAGHVKGARFGDYPPEHHHQAKGEVLAEFEMKPGDVLYIPHGLYHDAVASDGSSLHLSMAVRHMLVSDFLQQLVDDLPQDPFFRQHLPPPDPDAQQASDAMRAQTAQHLQQVLSQPVVGQGLRAFLKGKAFEKVEGMGLPSLEDPQQFRVRWLGRELTATQEGCRISSGGESLNFAGEEALLARYCFERDHVTSGMVEALPLSLPAGSRAVFLQQLVRMGLLEPL